jgi:hypothetical protein
MIGSCDDKLAPQPFRTVCTVGSGSPEECPARPGFRFVSITLQDNTGGRVWQRVCPDATVIAGARLLFYTPPEGTDQHIIWDGNVTGLTGLELGYQVGYIAPPGPAGGGVFLKTIIMEGIGPEPTFP